MLEGSYSDDHSACAEGHSNPDLGPLSDHLNFASRLEALNKEFGSQLLISASVREALV